MTDQLVADLRKNSRENIRVRRTEFQGHRLVDVRLFALKEDGSFVATAKGVSIRLEMIDAVIEALQKARAITAGRSHQGYAAGIAGFSGPRRSPASRISEQLGDVRPDPFRCRLLRSRARYAHGPVSGAAPLLFGDPGPSFSICDGALSVHRERHTDPPHGVLAGEGEPHGRHGRTAFRKFHRKKQSVFGSSDLTATYLVEAQSRAASSPDPGRN